MSDEVQPITVGDLIEALRLHDPERHVMIRMSPNYALHVDVLKASPTEPILLIYPSHEGVTLV